MVKEELVALTGKLNDAIVLNQMIYWSERVKDTDKFLNEEMERARKFMDGSQESEDDIKNNLLNGWIYKTSDEMIDETMLQVSRQTMDRIFKNLVNSEWICRRRNPKYKWDKTWQYRVDLYKIQNDLMQLGFSLEGYSLPNQYHEQSDDQNEQSNDQNEQSNAHYERSTAHNGQAIPEITTEITSEFEEEDIIEYARENKYYKKLNQLFNTKNIKQKIIDRTIMELSKRDINTFKINDVEKQVEHMMKKRSNGEPIYDFATYFANGLEEMMEQANVQEVYQKEQEINMQRKQNRDTSFYYDWLNDI